MIKQYQILRETIVRVIQNSGLDIGAAYFILKDVFYEMEKTYYAQLNRECLEEAKEINDEEADESLSDETDSIESE